MHFEECIDTSQFPSISYFICPSFVDRSLSKYQRGFRKTFSSQDCLQNNRFGFGKSFRAQGYLFTCLKSGKIPLKKVYNWQSFGNFARIFIKGIRLYFTKFRMFFLRRLNKLIYMASKSQSQNEYQETVLNAF